MEECEPETEGKETMKPRFMVEWVASGTHAHDYPGLAATGRAFSIPGVTVVVRRDGKIVRESLYYDMAEVQRQLGPR